MRSLSNYILESIKRLPSNKKGIIVFDIDDTLLTVSPEKVKIYKRIPGQDKEIALSTDEFAKDKDALDISKKSWFDYRDFRDPVKVYDSIVNGTPIIKNLNIMDAYIDAGYDFCFLTARSEEDVVADALSTFLKIRDKNTGAISQLERVFKRTMSHAINDTYRQYPGSTDAEKKSNVLRDICNKYDKVVFVDNDKKNIEAAKVLKSELKQKYNIDKLSVIKAW